jgi:hypothetical protein
LVFGPLAGCGDGGGGGGGTDFHKPLADPGGPYEGLVGEPVGFDGTGSSDVAGHVLTDYNWSFGDGSMGTGVTPTHTFSVAGTYEVSLQVCDGFECSFDPPSSKTTAFISAISVDDNPGITESDLELGNSVGTGSNFDIDGATRTVTADTIAAMESVEGPVDLSTSIIDSADTGTLQVLDQTIRVTPATILDSADFGVGGLTELLNNDYIEVHGLRRLDGTVDAFLVERKLPALKVIEMAGIIGTTVPLGDSFTVWRKYMGHL